MDTSLTDPVTGVVVELQPLSLDLCGCPIASQGIQLSCELHDHGVLRSMHRQNSWIISNAKLSNPWCPAKHPKLVVDNF